MSIRATYSALAAGYRGSLPPGSAPLPWTGPSRWAHTHAGGRPHVPAAGSPGRCQDDLAAPSTLSISRCPVRGQSSWRLYASVPFGVIDTSQIECTIGLSRVKIFCVFLSGPEYARQAQQVGSLLPTLMFWEERLDTNQPYSLREEASMPTICLAPDCRNHVVTVKSRPCARTPSLRRRTNGRDHFSIHFSLQAQGVLYGTCNCSPGSPGLFLGSGIARCRVFVPRWKRVCPGNWS